MTHVEHKCIIKVPVEYTFDYVLNPASSKLYEEAKCR